jgi:hypothetical protein
MRIARLMTAAAALVALTATTPAMADRDMLVPADHSAAQESKFQAQRDANGMSAAEARSLQARVDRVVARTGGTQVAINQVAWDGGDTLIPLPGETRARELGVTPSASTVHGCEYTQFCTYFSRGYNGVVDRISSCTWHVSHGFFQSYVNNQTPRTRAKFYTYYRDFITRTHPAFYKGTVPGWIAHRTHYIRPC